MLHLCWQSSPAGEVHCRGLRGTGIRPLASQDALRAFFIPWVPWENHLLCSMKWARCLQGMCRGPVGCPVTDICSRTQFLGAAGVLEGRLPFRPWTADGRSRFLPSRTEHCQRVFVLLTDVLLLCFPTCAGSPGITVSLELSAWRVLRMGSGPVGTEPV